jgi:hypothetical protein
MAQPQEDEIVQRAKAICSDEGKIWNVNQRPCHGDAIKIVDDATRTEYLSRARDQLIREQAKPANPRPD